MPLQDITETRKYSRSVAGSVASAYSERSSVASSALSTSSKRHRYLDDAISTVQSINSQLFSVGEHFEVQELRQQLRRACTAGSKVQTRADEYNSHILSGFIKELSTLEECIGNLDQSLLTQLAYDLGRISDIRASILETVTSKSCTISIADSHGAHNIAQETKRITELEGKVSELVSLLGNVTEITTLASALRQSRLQSGACEQQSGWSDTISRTIQPRTPQTGDSSLEELDSSIEVIGQPSSSRQMASPPMQHSSMPPFMDRNMGMQNILPYNGTMNGNSPGGTIPMGNCMGHVNPANGVMYSVGNGWPGVHSADQQGQQIEPKHQQQLTTPPTAPIYIMNNLRSDANAVTDVNQATSQVSHLLNTVKVKIKSAASNPLIAAIIGAVGMALIHNKVPILRRVGFGRGEGALQQEARDARNRAKAVAGVATDAVEDCHEELRDWREYSRRRGNIFDKSPEPSGSRCNLRRIKSSLASVRGSSQPEENDEDWRHT